jgi:hypothetical protein
MIFKYKQGFKIFFASLLLLALLILKLVGFQLFGDTFALRY